MIAASALAIPVPASRGVNLPNSVVAPNGVVYSWGKYQFNSAESQSWNNIKVGDYNAIGTHEQTYSYSYGYRGYYNTTYPDVYVDQTYTIYENSEYNYSMQNWITGQQSISLLLDTYRVDASYGDGLKLIWMAGLNGTWGFTYNITASHMISNMSYTSTGTQEVQYTLRDKDTMEVIPGAGRTETNPINNEYQYDYDSRQSGLPDTDFNQSIGMTVNFILPTFLTMQVYRTPTEDTVAWASMFNMMLIYNDTNHDGVYTVAPTGGAPSDLSLMMSNELAGVIMPEVASISMTMKMGGMDMTQNVQVPGDGSVQDYLDNVVFTPPSLSGNTATWGITYNDFPTMATVNGGQFMPAYYDSESGTSKTYPASMLSPANYSYSFSYAVEPETKEANFYTTVDIPRVTNSTLFNDVQNLSLCIPQYTYFLASSPIKKMTNDAASHQTDEFGFNIGTTPIADIGMAVIGKEKYSLRDYPTTGQTQEFNTTGGTVMAAVTESGSGVGLSAMSSNPFLPMIFSLDQLDEVKTHPGLTSTKSLYSITTQNYPVWSGYNLVSDPVFTVFFKSNLFPWVIWAVIGAIAVGVVVTIAIVIRKKRSAKS